jgi:predicted nucleotidyltransferase
MLEIPELPELYKSNLDRATKLLKAAGCTDIFLFGSLASGDVHERSDIDLAVRGCSKHDFFQILGKLLMELDYPVDLINLDKQDDLARYLEQSGELRQIS